MSGDERVVIQRVHETERIYFVSEDFISCEMEKMTAREEVSQKVMIQIGESELAVGIPDEARGMIAGGVAEMLIDNMHTCSLINDLGKIPFVEPSHLPDQITIGINPARTSWAQVHGQVIDIICKHLNLESVEVEVLGGGDPKKP